MWRGQALDMPSWWQELVEIPEVDDFQELAQKIQASFELPPENEQTTQCRELPPGSPSIQMSPCQKEFPPTARSKVPLPGYLRGTVGEDHVTYVQYSPILGREIQQTYTGPTMPFGGEHPQVEGSDGAICLLL